MTDSFRRKNRRPELYYSYSVTLSVTRTSRKALSTAARCELFAARKGLSAPTELIQGLSPWADGSETSDM